MGSEIMDAVTIYEVNGVKYTGPGLLLRCTLAGQKQRLMPNSTRSREAMC